MGRPPNLEWFGFPPSSFGAADLVGVACPFFFVVLFFLSRVDAVSSFLLGGVPVSLQLVMSDLYVSLCIQNDTHNLQFIFNVRSRFQILNDLTNRRKCSNHNSWDLRFEHFEDSTRPKMFKSDFSGIQI